MANKRNQQNDCLEQNSGKNCVQQNTDNSNGSRNAQSKKAHGGQNNRGNETTDCK